MLPALTNYGALPDGGLVVPTLDDLVEQFLSALEPSTRRAYDGDLRDFARHTFPDVKSPSPREALGLLLAHGAAAANLRALGYRTAMEARGLSSSIVRRRLSALKSAIELANTLGLVNWSLRVKRPRSEPRRDARGPGRDGWRRMVAQLVEERAFGGSVRRKAIRDLALVRLLHDLMLRRSEATELDLKHVEFDARPSGLWILGKGRKERERLEIVPVTASALADWIAERGTAPGPLFYRLDRIIDQKERLNDGSLARIVSELGERAGLSRHVTPHQLRHEGITRATELGLPLLEVQIAARHRDPRTTQRYIDRHNNPQGKISRLISED